MNGPGPSWQQSPAGWQQTPAGWQPVSPSLPPPPSGQPPYAQPTYGQPLYAQPQYAQQPYGQQQYAQQQYGQQWQQPQPAYDPSPAIHTPADPVTTLDTPAWLVSLVVHLSFWLGFAMHDLLCLSPK
jgi:hypothetical protein